MITSLISEQLNKTKKGESQTHLCPHHEHLLKHDFFEALIRLQRETEIFQH